jgi:hypothetical protein
MPGTPVLILDTLPKAELREYTVTSMHIFLASATSVV